MSPPKQSREGEETIVENIVRAVVKQLEESSLRLAIKTQEGRADKQHERHGNLIARLTQRHDAFVEEVRKGYMDLDKFRDIQQLQDQKNSRYEDREKWILLGMKWAAFGGGVGAAIEVVLQAMKKS